MCMCGAPSTDGCTTAEVDDGKELASQADNSDRFIFVIIYTALLAAMYAAKYCIKDQSNADPEPHDTTTQATKNETDAVSAAMAAQVERQERLQTEPEATATKEAADNQESSAGASKIAKLLGVVDSDTGEKLTATRFWIRNHELLGLCFDDKATKSDKASALGNIQAKGSRFKNASFAFGLCFTISIALMFQSVSIEATMQMESTNCYENDGAGTISTTQQMSIDQGGGGGYSFGDVGGPKVVVLCTLFKLVEGFLGKKIQEAFKNKAAFKEYLRFGVLVHLIGFVLSIVLGVSGASDASKSAPYVQKYCDAEDTGPDNASEGASMVGIYVQAILATQVADWVIGSNIQLTAQYCIGSWCMEDEDTAEDMQTEKQPKP